MSWTCNQCETINRDENSKCEVCDNTRLFTNKQNLKKTRKKELLFLIGLGSVGMAIVSLNLFTFSPQTLKSTLTPQKTRNAPIATTPITKVETTNTPEKKDSATKTPTLQPKENIPPKKENNNTTQTIQITESISTTIILIGSGYENWGSPAGLDNPNSPDKCQAFNNSKPIKKLEISILVENNTKELIEGKTYYGVTKDTNNENIFTCYFPYTGEIYLPQIPGLEKRYITFAAYMSQDKFAKSFTLANNNGKISNQVLLPINSKK